MRTRYPLRAARPRLGCEIAGGADMLLPHADWGDMMTEPAEPLPPAADPYQPDAPVAAPQDYPTSPVVAPPPPLPYNFPPPPPRKKSKALKIVLISLAAVFLLCVSGSASVFIWVRNTAAQPTGADTPDDAAKIFLSAAYRYQDPKKMKDAVCAEARDDKKIAAQINGVHDFAKGYDKPTFTWGTLTVADRSATKATVRVELIMTTEDLKQSKQQLKLDAVQDKGWWICAVHLQ
jgi:hypothetical protein